MCVLITYKEQEFSLSWYNILARDKKWFVEILFSSSHFVFISPKDFENNLIRILDSNYINIE